MSDKKDMIDVTFIGGGPAGLYGAHYAGRRGLTSRIVESLPQLGGRLMALYPDKMLHDVAGHPAILARDFVEQLVEQALSHQPEVRLGERVTGLRQNKDRTWQIETTGGKYSSRTVVVAAGVAAYVPKALEGIAAEEQEAWGVYYQVGDPARYAGKRVVIAGAGDNAIDWAAKVAPHAASVLLANRLNRFGDDPALPARLVKQGVEILFPYYEMKEVHGESRVEAVTIVDARTGAEERREADVLLLNTGYVANLHQLEGWGLKAAGNSLVVDERMRSNLAGVYAAGDVVNYVGKLKLISIAAGEAATAVADIASELKEREKEKKAGRRVEHAMEVSGRFYSGYEAVQMAIAMIRNSVRFFRTAVIGAKDDGVKNLFAKLQREGLQHVEELQNKVLPKYAGGGYAVEDLDDTALAYLRDAVDPFVFGGHRLAQDAMRGGFTSDMDAIYTGIRVHEDTVSFFEHLVREPSLAGTKPELEKLLEGARHHLDVLLKQQKDLMENGVGS